MQTEILKHGDVVAGCIIRQAGDIVARGSIDEPGHWLLDFVRPVSVQTLGEVFKEAKKLPA